MVAKSASIYHVVGRNNLGALNFGAATFTYCKRQGDRSESVASSPRAHTWICRRDALANLPVEEVFGPLGHHRSRHHWVTRTRARGGAPDTTSPHRGSNDLAAGGSSKHFWPSFAAEPFGSRFVVPHLERNDLGLCGLS
jgi:hypothetical protein